MSHVKAGGSAKNNRKAAGKRLGVKLFGGQATNAGQVIVRQVGSNKIAGPGTYMSRDFTIHAGKAGVVGFEKVRIRRFSGKTVPRTQVVVQ